MVREIIKLTISDMVKDFLYYDRKEDGDLEVGVIEKAIQDGVISKTEIIEHFKECLDAAVP